MPVLLLPHGDAVQRGHVAHGLCCPPEGAGGEEAHRPVHDGPAAVCMRKQDKSPQEHLRRLIMAYNICLLQNTLGTKKLMLPYENII